MKKIFILFILICTMNFFNPFLSVFADVKQKQVKGENLVIIKDNNLYGLKESGSGKEIFPIKFKKINKYKHKDKNIFIGQNANIIAFYSPNGLYDNFLKNYYENFNEIKFENYPENGAIIYKKDKNTGVIGVNNGIIYVTTPAFINATYPDINSFASKFLNVSYAPFDKIILYSNSSRNSYISFQDLINHSSDLSYHHWSQGKALFEKADISEEIQIKDNKLHSKYQNFIFPDDNVISYVYDVKKQAKITFSNDFMQNYNHFETTDELYSFLEKSYNIELKNYPKNIMIVDGTRAEIYKDGETNVLKYKKFNPNCKNMLLNTITGLNISFQNPDFIAISNGQYGIINYNNEIKIPLKRDDIEPLYCNIQEKLYLNKETGKPVLEFIDKQENDKYFIEKTISYNSEKQRAEAAYNLINQQGETEARLLSGFNYKEYEIIQKAADESFQSIQNAQRRKENIKSLPGEILYFTLGIAFLPIILVCPNFARIYAFIDYY